MAGAWLSLVSLASIWMMGFSKWRRLAFGVGMVNQIGWTGYVLFVVWQPGLLLLEVPLVAIYARHCWKGD